MVSKLVTVDGDRLRTPRNLQVPLGISFRDALAACDGDDNITQVIENGLMSGTMNSPDDSVVTKRTFCITAQNEFHIHSGNLRDCIRCGQCENVCPMRLPVTHIRARWIAGDIKGCADLGIALCVGCGLCSTECCADIPLAELMRSIKAEISANEGRCYGE
jgi:electron transport complex protein RnfC